MTPSKIVSDVLAAVRGAYESGISTANQVAPALNSTAEKLRAERQRQVEAGVRVNSPASSFAARHIVLLECVGTYHETQSKVAGAAVASLTTLCNEAVKLLQDQERQIGDLQQRNRAMATAIDAHLDALRADAAGG